jgi:DNA replication protein DnaC
MDHGVIYDHVYYTFCGILGKRFCECAAGKEAFKKWCLTAEVQNAIHQKRTKEVENALTFSGIPKRWKEKSLETLEGQEVLKQTVNRYLDHFPKFQGNGQGMYLWSHGSGRGKTHVLSAICQEIIRKFCIPCIFMTEERIFMKIREAYDNPQVSEQERFQKFLEIPCLFIDDFGVAKVTSWKNEVMTSLLDYRLSNQLPTFFTSNYHPQEFEQVLKNSGNMARPERIPSRIYELCERFIIEVKGEDFRKKQHTTP